MSIYKYIHSISPEIECKAQSYLLNIHTIKYNYINMRPSSYGNWVKQMCNRCESSQLYSKNYR